MTVPKKLNVGVVGIGRMGQSHALNLLHKTPRANLLCACSPAEQDIVWGREHLAPHGVKLYPSFEEMIATPGLDAIVIASLSAFHAEQTTAALDKGIHVLCEKPVCTTVGEVRKCPDHSTLMKLTIESGSLKPSLSESRRILKRS